MSIFGDRIWRSISNKDVSMSKSMTVVGQLPGGCQTASITRPYALPPGTPKDRVQMLRRAFRETMKDKDFLAEAIKSKLDVDPVSGE